MPTNVVPRILTAKELFELPTDGKRYQLVQGALQMMSPAGGQHGRVANHVAWLLNSHVQPNGLGVVLAAETGFLIAQDPDTVLAPDVAFVQRARYETLHDDTGYLPLAPDLAVEVISPNDRFSRVETKALAWLDAGCQLVLLVAPESRSIHAYRSRQQIQVYQDHETIDCSPAVPKWHLSVRNLFDSE